MNSDAPSEVRSDEQFDEEGLARYLREHVPTLEGPMRVQQFHGGKANLTYALSFGDTECVLRRPPLGPVAPKSHDMRREYRGLAALAPVYPYSPRPIHLCEDEGVIGAVFFLMERRNGIVIRGEWPSEFGEDKSLRRKMSESLVDALADLHAVDTELPEIRKLGKPDGFVARQVSGWSGRWEGAKTREIPEMDEVTQWLNSHIPDSKEVCVLHNDYKLDNTIYSLDAPGRLVGVFDWDMVSLGDPLADLGTLLGYWPDQADVDARGGVSSTVSHLPGFLTRRVLAERYAERTGFDISDLPFFEVFALFRIAVIIEQIYVRWLRGQTKDARFEALGDGTPQLARSACQRISRI